MKLSDLLAPEMVDELALTIRTNLSDVIDGAADDVQRFAQSIARDTLMALQEPNVERRTAMLEELRAQVRGLAELNRIRVNAAAWDTVNRILTVATTVAVNVLTRAATLI